MMGVFSHETALSLHDLSDVLPSTVHITLPASWQKRRFRIPRGVFLHFTDVTKADRAWVGSVPVTSPRRTLYDCVEAHTSPETIEKAVQDAVNRGLVTKSEADEITAVQRKEKKSG
jgi:predicted transcriptional regulator of viral defense system